MSDKKEFKAESKRLLDLMINSIYTHKEIFLRELISNASDASDKLYYKALQENITSFSREDMAINLIVDKENRTLTIADEGIGMTKEELEEHLGTIANSGSYEFKNALEKGVSDVDIIGQFGVGFYSAFMVADEVEVYSKKYGEDKAYLWKSDTSDGYTVEEVEKAEHGTTIILHLKKDTEEEDYSKYLDQYEIERLVKKYSDYVHYPIKMDVTTSRKKEDSDEYEDVVENKTLNSQVPLWKRQKKDITKEEYDEFYKEGLQLYSRGVFIMDHAEDLVPEHFRFVKGLVDSQDLNLNISREMLQHDRKMKVIANKIEKRIQTELEKMLKNDRDEYITFFKNFGMQLKFGIYNSYGMLKDKLQDLLMFYSSDKKELITLKEYVEAMPEDQKEIYYASGETVEKCDLLPQVEAVKSKGYDVLYMTDNVDEFCLQMMRDYDSKTFKNVTQGDLDLETEDEKKELEQKTEDNKPLLEIVKKALGDKVQDVKLSHRLKSHPVCLASGDGVSFEMEKVLNQMPDAQGIKAGRILEINPDHDLFKSLQSVYEKEPVKIDEYASILFDQALLIAGFSIDDPVDFSNKITKLMIEASK